LPHDFNVAVHAPPEAIPEVPPHAVRKMKQRRTPDFGAQRCFFRSERLGIE